MGNVGEALPNIELQTPTGTLHLPIRGTPIVLEYYRGTWCPFCKQHIGALQREDLGDARLYMVSTEMCDQQRAFKESRGLNLFFASDPEGRAGEALGVVRADGSRWHEKLDRVLHKIDYGYIQPATFVIDHQGILRFQHIATGYMGRLKARRLQRVLGELRLK